MTSDSETLPFRYTLRVRYSECDAQKIVFNARYGIYVDIAVLEFVRALPVAPRLIDGDLDYRLVRQTLEWRAPARFDQVLELRVKALRLGTTSFTLACEFRVAGTEPIIATAETVYVMVDAVEFAKTPIPADVRDALATGAPDIWVDHAGVGRES